MWKEFLKPWMIVAAAFLLFSGVLLRVVEYQLPTAAQRLYNEVGERYDALTQQDAKVSVPDAENAVPVFEEACRAMMDALVAFPEHDGYFLTWKIEDDPSVWELQPVYVLPLPSQPFPESVHENIRRCVAAYRPVLETLHRAAAMTLPDDFWGFEVPADRTQERLYHTAYYRMERLLFLEALAAVLDREEGRAMRAFHTLAAWKKVQANNAILHSRSTTLLAGGAAVLFREAIHYGMEHGVLSATSLAALQDLFTYVPETTKKDIVRKFLASQKQAAYWQQRDGAMPSLLQETFHEQRIPALRAGLLWYEKRLHVQGITACMAGLQAIQRLIFGDASPYLADLMNRSADSYFAYYPDSPFIDPYERFEPLNFYHFYHYSMYGGVTDQETWRLRFLRLTLALGRYRLDKGAFPETVSALEGYIPEEDMRIFSAPSYRYERTDTGWILNYKTSDKRDIYKPWLSYPLGAVKIDSTRF